MTRAVTVGVKAAAPFSLHALVYALGSTKARFDTPNCSLVSPLELDGLMKRSGAQAALYGSKVFRKVPRKLLQPVGCFLHPIVRPRVLC